MFGKIFIVNLAGGFTAKHVASVRTSNAVVPPGDNTTMSPGPNSRSTIYTRPLKRKVLITFRQSVLCIESNAIFVRPVGS